MSTSQGDSAHGFDRFDLSPRLLRAVAASGYEEPRPIQLQTIPAVLDGRDVMGLAQTGTGKTAAFALPILERLLEKRLPGPRVLVIAPTRELAIQIDGEFRSLARSTKIRTVTIYGGVSERPQIQALRRNPDVIVACPGRLLDLLQRDLFDLDNVETLVLDEADHMFDMGFLPDIRRILARLPRERQNLLFAATMPREIRHLAEQILVDPFVSELAHSAPAQTIEHALYPVAEKRKMDLLIHFLSQDDFVSAIVFTRTKHRAKRLAIKLDKAGHRAIGIQGNMSQSQRDRAMEGFRRKRYDVLVATDIVARGIDVSQVSHVINFDVPNTPEAYTHRIGRTGRSERSGIACTFVTEDDRKMVQAIERTLRSEIPMHTVEGFEEVYMPRRTGVKRGGHQAGQTTGGPRRGRKRVGRKPREHSGGDSRSRSQSSSGQRRRRRRGPGGSRRSRVA